MPYDICEDEAALDYIEGEMAKRGVTQQLIDETRAAMERQMLVDMKKLAASGGNLECYDSQGATPVSNEIMTMKCKYIFSSLSATHSSRKWLYISSRISSRSRSKD